jgi:hypothetical protein
VTHLGLSKSHIALLGVAHRALEGDAVAAQAAGEQRRRSRHANTTSTSESAHNENQKADFKQAMPGMAAESAGSSEMRTWLSQTGSKNETPSLRRLPASSAAAPSAPVFSRSWMWE